VLKELDPSGRLDKDFYRMGGAGEDVLAKFNGFAAVTAAFASLD